MLSLTLLLLTVLIFILPLAIRLSRNLRAATSSGFSYILVPISAQNQTWRVLGPLLQHLLRPVLRPLLPPPLYWRIKFTLDSFPYAHTHTPFRYMGTDTFIAVSPGGNILMTCDAGVIAQTSGFPKPVEDYALLDIHGTNIVTTEGANWRRIRKVVAPFFGGERINRLVWREGLRLTAEWIEEGKFETVAEDASRLSLSIISLVGFGKDISEDGRREMGEGHELRYSEALFKSTKNAIVLFLVPRFLRNILQRFISRIKEAHQAYVEWGKYLNEMLEDRRAEIAEGKDQSKGIDLMGTLVGAGTSSTANDFFDAADSAEKKPDDQKSHLSNVEITGNANIFVFAGHETTFNSIHLSILLLALHPASQRRLQADLDLIFRGRSVSEWGYERDFPRLLNSMCGAVLNEQLRLIGSSQYLPKCTRDSARDIIVEGRKCRIPPNTKIWLLLPVVHRNPNFWPHGPPTDPDHPAHPTSNRDNDLEEFKPERWILADSKCESLTTFHEVSSQDPSASSLYRPPKGAFIPFSEGYRGCLGKRFAQVEIIAILAFIFSQYSVELALDAPGDKEGDNGVSYEQLEAMTEAEKRELWRRRRGEVRKLVREKMIAAISFQLSQKVPLRFVKRGKERFFDFET